MSVAVRYTPNCVLSTKLTPATSAAALQTRLSKSSQRRLHIMEVTSSDLQYVLDKMSYQSIVEIHRSCGLQVNGDGTTKEAYIRRIKAHLATQSNSRRWSLWQWIHTELVALVPILAMWTFIYLPYKLHVRRTESVLDEIAFDKAIEYLETLFGWCLYGSPVVWACVNLAFLIRFAGGHWINIVVMSCSLCCCVICWKLIALLEACQGHSILTDLLLDSAVQCMQELYLSVSQMDSLNSTETDSDHTETDGFRTPISSPGVYSSAYVRSHQSSDVSFETAYPQSNPEQVFLTPDILASGQEFHRQLIHDSTEQKEQLDKVLDEFKQLVALAQQLQRTTQGHNTSLNPVLNKLDEIYNAIRGFRSSYKEDNRIINTKLDHFSHNMQRRNTAPYMPPQDFPFRSGLTPLAALAPWRKNSRSSDEDFDQARGRKVSRPISFRVKEGQMRSDGVKGHGRSTEPNKSYKAKENAYDMQEHRDIEHDQVFRDALHGMIRNTISREPHEFRIARLRPIQHDAEDNALETGEIRISDNYKVHVQVDGSESIHPFDIVLKGTATTAELSSVIQPLISDGVDIGPDVLFIADGATGSGKTWTMFHDSPSIVEQVWRSLSGSLASPHERPRALGDGKATDGRAIYAEAVEFYQDGLRDPLSGTSYSRNDIKQDGNAFWLPDVTRKELQGQEDMKGFFQSVNQERMDYMTEHGEVSSRSHLLCTVSIRQQQDNRAGPQLRGIRFLDIAGAIRGDGALLGWEPRANAALTLSRTMLHRILRDRRDTGIETDCNLTRLLRACLGPDSKTRIVLITCFTPSRENLKLTRSILQETQRVETQREVVHSATNQMSSAHKKESKPQIEIQRGNTPSPHPYPKETLASSSERGRYVSKPTSPTRPKRRNSSGYY